MKPNWIENLSWTRKSENWFSEWYHASRKAIKSFKRTFCGSLHNEIDVKQHETIRKKHFTVYPRLQIHLSTLQNLLQNSIHYSSWLSNIKEKVMKDSFAEKDFLTLWKSRQRIFLLFDVRGLFTTDKKS